MIDADDFIHLPYTSDLTETGIAHVLRSLPYSFDRASGPPFNGLRRAVAGTAVELAFRRYLSGQDIPFEVQGPAPFTNPDRYDVSLGGHRCDIQSFLISQREKISAMHRDPYVMLEAAALVSSDGHAGSGHSDHDLYLFAFLCGLIAASPAAVKKASETSQPLYLLHVPGVEWRKPMNWSPLGPLVFKSESDDQMLVEVSGQDASREFLTRTFNLPSKTKVVVDDPFYSLTAVHVDRVPTARVGIHSPAGKQTYVIGPMDWGNIWVYGMDIYLAGYITHREFGQQARPIAPNSRVFQDDHTYGKNLAVPVADLSPLSGLFEKVRAWDGNKNQ